MSELTRRTYLLALGAGVASCDPWIDQAIAAMVRIYVPPNATELLKTGLNNFARADAFSLVRGCIGDPSGYALANLNLRIDVSRRPDGTGENVEFDAFFWNRFPAPSRVHLRKAVRDLVNALNSVDGVVARAEPEY